MGTKTAKVGAGAPKLASLPPTSEAFHENVLRAHFTVANWLRALDNGPVDIDPTQYGWVKDEINKVLIPCTVRDGVAMAPDEILQVIKCSCSASPPCKSGRFGYACKGMPCTIFYACGASGCNNPFNKTVMDDSDIAMDSP